MRAVLSAAACLLVAVAPAAQTPRPTVAELFDNPVVARGSSFEIRQAEWDDHYRALKATLATQGQTIPPTREEEARLRLLDRLILARVIDRRATPADRVEANQTADRLIQETRQRAPSEASYARQLLAVGMTVENFESRAREQALVEQVINREIRATLTVSSDEVLRFYTEGDDVRTRQLAAELARLEAADSNPSLQERLRTEIASLQQANLQRLDRPERVRAQLLLFFTSDRLTREPFPPSQIEAKRQLATQIRQRLIDGADFPTIARQYSDDPDVLETGGEYVAARTANMAPELKQALFDLSPGVWSDLILTRPGFYLARVLERLPAGKVSLDSAESDIREFLLIQKVEERIPDYFEALKKEYGVEVQAASR